MGLEGAVGAELVGGFASSEGPQFLFDVPSSSGSGSLTSVVRKEERSRWSIGGVLFSLRDWIAQCFKGKPLFEFRQGKDVQIRPCWIYSTWFPFSLHYYHVFCELILHGGGTSTPVAIYIELRATSWPMLTAGWKLWPFAHLATNGLIPTEQRLHWGDRVELVWILERKIRSSNDQGSGRSASQPTIAEISQGMTLSRTEAASGQ
ncbi:hypothetical protein MLD38_000509 [Melastoma candidum]|uniref:Uncharacterized protein n=1 Tax=Melastoma candidum TaxID=119954 RepID=A0ACB9SA33_9MYRT|nr:hypothetical protein MLD38_000509 [Melastoma candidum]